MLTLGNTAVNRDTIAGLYDRLHNVNFFQGSVDPRNILVQPGPFTCPRAERSFDNPSYRIIDFGGGACYNGFEEEYADERMRKRGSVYDSEYATMLAPVLVVSSSEPNFSFFNRW